MENQEAVKVNTERLFMRTITDDDAATVANLFSDEFETENAALEHIRWINNNAYENRLVFNFYIWLKGTEDCIGRVYIHSKPELGGEVEIGYGISEIYRNKGYATEAARVMVDYAFEKLGQEVGEMTDFEKIKEYYKVFDEQNRLEKGEGRLEFDIAFSFKTICR